MNASGLGAVHSLTSTAEPTKQEEKLRTALIIEDNRVDRLLLEHLLIQENFRVLTAADGEQGVGLFEQYGPDIVFVDVVMPRMDGFETTAHIKALSKDGFIPVIFITSLDDDAAPLSCIDAGGDDYIPKPFNPNILRAKLAAIERIRAIHLSLANKHRALSKLHNHMEREQEIAERVYANVVTADNQALNQIRVLFRPATTFSGDLFLTARQPSGGLNILVGDFTGHGLSGAIGALPVAETFRAMTAKGFSTLEILKQINKKLNTILPTGMFMCACFVSVDKNGESILVWNGGLPDVLILNRETGKIEQHIPSTHLPLGISGSLSEEDQPQLLEISEGDRIVVYSDGLIEAMNLKGEMFGLERLKRYLENVGDGEQAFFQIEQDLNEFCEGRSPDDDITLVDIPYEPALLVSEKTSPPLQRHGPEGNEAHDWRWVLELRGTTLRRINPIPLAMSQLQELWDPQIHHEPLYTVISELFTNALDHGVLKLSSELKLSAEGFAHYYREREQRLGKLQDGFVRIELKLNRQKTSNSLLISVKDSGDGFDYDERMAKALDLASDCKFSGRGIPLVKSLCQSLRYYGRGNRAEALYVMQR